MGLRLAGGPHVQASTGTFETFDPETGEFRVVEEGSPRSGHTATLLEDGTVLIAGCGTVPAELYDSGSDSLLFAPPMVAIS